MAFKHDSPCLRDAMARYVLNGGVSPWERYTEFLDTF